MSSRSAARVRRDVEEAERGEALLDRGRRERAGARERVEERRKEQPLVDRADAVLATAILGLEEVERGLVATVAVAQHASQPGASGDVGREGVGLLLVLQLEAVLDRAQESVRVVELPGVVLLDVAAGGELRERVERGRRPYRCVVTTVHELEELHRELDVADATPPPLDLALREAAAVHLAFGARLHRPHRAHGVGIQDVGPDEGLRALEEAPAEVVVAGNGASLEEGLELPWLCPALVIRPVRVERA